MKLLRRCGLKFLALLLALVLAGCESTPSPPAGDSGPQRIPRGVLTQADPVPSDEPLSASGNSMSYVVFGKRYYRLKTARGFDEEGVASWYGRKFHGRLTASGEPYDMYTMTAAHKSLPLPTFARVTNLRNNRSIVVRINDRGPFVDDRLIDLSYAAAAKLDMLAAGTARVRVQTLSGVPGETLQRAPERAPEPKPLPYKVPQPILSGPTVAQQADPAPLPRYSSPDRSGSASAGTTLALRAPASSKSSLKGSKNSLTKSLTNGHYLQLGAFGNFDAAGEMKSRVDPALPVEVFVAKQSDSELYRVQAGPFATLERLTAIRQQLLTQFAIDAIPLLRDEASPICC